jgi:hypothetical protein
MSNATVTLKIKRWEALHLTKHKTGPGGFGGFHLWIVEMFNGSTCDVDGHFTLELSDAEVGRIIRHMGHGEGGWQAAIRKTFTQAILRQIGYE